MKIAKGLAILRCLKSVVHISSPPGSSDVACGKRTRVNESPQPAKLGRRLHHETHQALSGADHPQAQNSRAADRPGQERRRRLPVPRGGATDVPPLATAVRRNAGRGSSVADSANAWPNAEARHRNLLTGIRFDMPRLSLESANAILRAHGTPFRLIEGHESRWLSVYVNQPGRKVQERAVRGFAARDDRAVRISVPGFWPSHGIMPRGPWTIC
jgi:hypothetical protein